MSEKTNVKDHISKWPDKYKLLLVSFLVAIIVRLMYMTGGSHTSFAQLLHIPIFLSTYFWRIKGGVISALVSGIVVGPFMPLNVAEGVMQTPGNWLVRIVVFLVVGVFTGYVFKHIDRLHEQMREKDLTNPLTGLYNRNKFYMDAKKNIEKEQTFTIYSVKLTNLDSIGKYVDPKLVEKLISRIIKDFKDECKKIKLYSYYNDEFIVTTFPQCNHTEFIEKLVEKYASSFKIDSFEVRLPMKVGVYEYLGGKESPSKILDKARIAYEQASEQEYGIYFYSKKIEEEMKEIFEIAGSIPDAVKNKDLYLVYQPKVRLEDNSLDGVEILSRWDRGSKKPVGPNVFIRIAEEIGQIKEISQYVMENAFKQIAKWESKNIVMNYAINVTARELLDVEFVEWAEDLVDQYDFDRTHFEIELTERVLCQEGDKLTSILKYLRSLGYKISVDDFGTGYNSLATIGEIPFDILKIDKYFIDRLDRMEVRELIKSMISYAHRLNKVVVAEGIETKDQLDYMRRLGCDMAQGYYFSKPLLSEEFEKKYLF